MSNNEIHDRRYQRFGAHLAKTRRMNEHIDPRCIGTPRMASRSLPAVSGGWASVVVAGVHHLREGGKDLLRVYAGGGCACHSAAIGHHLLGHLLTFVDRCRQE